jgi:hypothetical protein
MLEAVEYLIEDNDRWISPEIAMRLGSDRTGKALGSCGLIRQPRDQIRVICTASSHVGRVGPLPAKGKRLLSMRTALSSARDRTLADIHRERSNAPSWRAGRPESNVKRS